MKQAHEARWFRVDPSALDVPKRSIEDGVEIHVFMSPYDIPEAVRGSYDDRLSRFVIEFRYVDDEKWNKAKQSKYLDARIGKHSRRLLGLEIDVDSLKADAVALKVYPAEKITDIIQETAIEAIEELSGATSERVDNYRVAKDILKTQRDHVFADLAGAK